MQVPCVGMFNDRIGRSHGCMVILITAQKVVACTDCMDGEKPLKIIENDQLTERSLISAYNCYVDGSP